VKKIRVAVIAGGFSSEREVSLKSGAQMRKGLDPKKYQPRLIEITKEGRWLLAAPSAARKSAKPLRSLTLLNPERGITKRDFENIDVALIGLHGKFGEDGKIQSLLELIGLPYTGSGVLASALAMDKVKTMELAALAGIRVPKFIAVAKPSSRTHSALLKNIRVRIRMEIGYPLVVKPNESGSSVGVSIIHSERELPEALRATFAEDATAIIQQYIRGRELTCGVMGNTRQTKLLALPPIEIIPGEAFFDYEAKYNSPKTQEICPADIPKKVGRDIQDLSKRVHALLGCDGLTRSDFILDKKNRLYFLEINTIPGMTEASLCPKEAKALGWSFGEFLDKIIGLAVKKAPANFSQERSDWLKN
jgi:D-alanine-D-alanine ligase